uniref:Putative MO25-like protein At5g47540 n=1 Tax=Rhizophora mucronata TaxID=61149 RepID=A0A2P2MFI2_RHIMU
MCFISALPCLPWPTSYSELALAINAFFSLIFLYSFL